MTGHTLFDGGRGAAPKEGARTGGGHRNVGGECHKSRNAPRLRISYKKSTTGYYTYEKSRRGGGREGLGKSGGGGSATSPTPTCGGKVQNLKGSRGAPEKEGFERKKEFNLD